MDVWTEWLFTLLKGIPSLFTTPFTYLLLFLIALQWRRQIDMERKLFSAKLHTVAEGVLQSVFFGLLGGLVASLFIVGFGVVLSAQVFLFLWLVAILLALFHVRYLCFAYAGAILALLVALVDLFPQLQTIPVLATLGETVGLAELPSIFVLVAFLHLVEALLVYLSGAKKATPIFIHSKRGRLVGAFHIQHFWFVPLFLLIPSEQNVVQGLFQGWPIFSGELLLPLSLMLVPAVLGYSEQTISATPQQKARSSAIWLVIYSVVLIGFSALTAFISAWFIWPTILFSFLGHDAMIWASRMKEAKAIPIYVHPNEGLKILAIIPGSPAAKMGLQAGEVILKANGQALKRRKDLYAAMQNNLAFCKLDVLDLQGEIKFPKSSVYQEDHHQLGIILCPDEDVPYYLEGTSNSLLQLLLQRLNRKSTKQNEEIKVKN
ncbi:PDZ domain-containing protein [Bacillus horti]|uniref:PDZ domain-containing protein n=1 Tax=Caldalkalibacillus horti TaxID=77523 RepID=A0ABT9VZ84_9BACI|nr:PDZ domain-containing protein [Bacillus horti]MDQ0166313.1 hypothetical protein [Bacillus horti]